MHACRYVGMYACMHACRYVGMYVCTYWQSVRSIRPTLHNDVHKIGVSWYYNCSDPCIVCGQMQCQTGINLLVLWTWSIELRRIITDSLRISGFPAVRNVKQYACCPDPYIDLTFDIELRRRKLYYVVNIVTPCLMLAGLTVVTFTIPPDAGEKISFGKH